MKVAIAGFAAEGRVNFEYWSKLGADITIVDEKNELEDLPEGVPTILGEGAFKKLDNFDMVVRTASLSPSLITTNGKIWSATNEFFAKCPAQIIGVTGTKGKGTTCTLIAEILRAADFNVHLLGNIGTPALSVLDKIKADDIVVFELSSFQLWDLEKSPQTAVVLMIEPDHMDVHASMEDYIEAKAHIAKFQEEDDLLVYHPTNSYSAQIAVQSPAHKKQYMTQKGGAYIEGGQIIVGDVAVAQTEEVALIGEHNLENICAALAAAWKYTQNVEAIQIALKTFRGLPHRLEFVRELDGVKYYNDSFSSAPGAAVAALRAFTQPTILICGGYDKGGDFSVLASALAESSHVKKVLVIGDMRYKISEAFKNATFTNFEILETTDFAEIIRIAQAQAASGDVVLLSPGTSSFDMFKSFYDRGEQFKERVREL